MFHMIFSIIDDKEEDHLHGVDASMCRCVDEMGSHV